MAEREPRARADARRARRRGRARLRPRRAAAPGARGARRAGRGLGARRGGEPVAGARIAVARGPAFSFHYEENLELLRAAGAELVDLDPLADEALPPRTGALVLAGGFPEVYGEELSANCALRAEIAAFAARGRPILAECGGLLYLARELDGRPMCGVVPVAGAHDRAPEPRLPRGDRRRRPPRVAGGHDGARPRVPLLARRARRRPQAPAWTLRARGVERTEGHVVGAVHASYLHTHWAATPGVAARCRGGRCGAAAPSRR